MSAPQGSSSSRCPQCGAPMSAGVAGQCGACLLRLATLDPEPPVESASAASFEEWLKLKGQRIGGYELLDEIARGGMGIVYRARQVAAGRTVALKLMLPQLMHLPGMRARFRHEVEAVAQLDHAGILPIYEVGEHAGLPFYSTKFAEGGSLDRRAAALQGDWRAIARIVLEVARAVDYAHGKGILHRDLKPANILFDAAGAPMVGDFGLAKFRAVEQGVTLPASALGSPNYMAPEQISAQFGELGPATDVYGLGAVLYELLTGRPPIQGEDAAATLRQVPVTAPAPGVSLRADIPPDLDGIALKCLARQPAQRYASAAALALDLQAWLDGTQTAAHRGARLQKLRRWAANAGAGVLLIALIAGGGTYLRGAGAGRESAVVSSSLSTPRSVAVLPMRNLGPDRADDYLGAMVTDDLLRDLRQVVSLDVVPFRVSVDDPAKLRPAELSARLGVDLLLDGEFVRQGEALRVRARLWDTKSQRATWQHDFATTAADMRDMRSGIATALVTQLQIQVGSDLRAQLRPDALTSSAPAYADYLRARYLIRWRRPETLGEAARLLREAVALDDDFARAHSALAYTYALSIPFEPEGGEYWKLATQSARRALARNPSLGEPHAVLGDYHSIAGKPIDAELDFQRALELEPRDPAALHLYAIHLYSMGRLKDALDMERRSVANDGTSPQPIMWLAMATTLVGETQEARRLWQTADELGAARPLCAAVARLELGQDDFLDEWYHTQTSDWYLPARGAQRRGAPPDTRELHAGVVDPTRRAAALAWLRGREPQLDPAFAITHYGLLGDADDAFRVAEAFDLPDDTNYLYQLCNIWSPRTAVIRRDPRFGALMKRWGFVEYWRRFGSPESCSIEGESVSCR
ncbi:MAG TPA: protein kinase [Steroidobacteraceae bacterium]|nr:protein kinase [Steroidobacteraceae bacterium]